MKIFKDLSVGNLEFPRRNKKIQQEYNNFL